MLSSSKDDMIGWLRPPASLKPVACSAYGLADLHAPIIAHLRFAEAQKPIAGKRAQHDNEDPDDNRGHEYASVSFARFHKVTWADPEKRRKGDPPASCNDS
jgi:hypothetical protein